MATREEHAKDPFRYTALGRMDQSVAGIVKQLWALIQRSPALRPYLWMGSGWRTGSVEHQSGTAIDIMVTRKTGLRPSAEERKAAMMLISWLIKHASTLKIKWILFSRDGQNRTESWNRSRGGWRALKSRGSISADHIDHIHVKFDPASAWSAVLSALVVGGTPQIRGGVSGQASKPATVPSLKKGKTWVHTVQNAMNVLRGLNLAEDGVYGKATREAVAGFQRYDKRYEATYGRKLAVDGKVGPETKKALRLYGVQI